MSPLWYHRTDSYRWINGSIRQDLLPDERSVWADLMALAALTREPRRGYIERSEGIPYSKTVLLSMLNITGELFDRAVAKCVKEGRLKVFEDGTMLLTNWQYYNDVNELAERKEREKEKKEYTKRSREKRLAENSALIRAINVLNARLKALEQNDEKYIIKDDNIINTETGEMVSVEQVLNEYVNLTDFPKKESSGTQ